MSASVSPCVNTNSQIVIQFYQKYHWGRGKAELGWVD